MKPTHTIFLVLCLCGVLGTTPADATHSRIKGADGETVFSPEFLRDYESAILAVHQSRSAEPLLQLLKRYKQAEQVAELEVSLGLTYGQREGIIDPAKAVAHFSNALRYDLPERTRLEVLSWRGDSLEQLQNHDAALKDYLRGLLACSYHDLSGGSPETKRPSVSFDIRSDDPEDVQRERDYREYQQRIDLQRFLLQLRFYFLERVKRLRSRSNLGDEQLLAILEELSPDTSRYVCDHELLGTETKRSGPSPREQEVDSTPSNVTIDNLVDESIAARGRAVKPTKGDDNKSAKVAIKMFELEHADAEETKGMLDNLIGPGEIVIAEKRLNLVIVKGSPEFLAMVEVLLLRHDQPAKPTALQRDRSH